MNQLLRICHATHFIGDRLSVRVGQLTAWLTLALALATAAVVVMRLLFQWGSISGQESLTYMHALVVMLTSAYTLSEDGHVRVDIFYRQFNAVQKAWVNAAGTCLFLLPFALFTVLISWQYVVSAWQIHEGSADAGGIAAVFLLKTLILCNGCLLIVQGLAELAKDVNTLTKATDHHA